MAGRGVNKVILVGNAGRDPEIRRTKDDTAIANVNLATSSTWFDRSANEQREHTEWHRVVFFGKLAEVVEKYVSRGDRLYVEGRLQTRKWEDQRTGQDRYSTEIVGNEMVMLSNAGDSGRQSRSDGGYRNSSDQPASRSSDTGFSSDSVDDLDDDLPW